MVVGKDVHSALSDAFVSSSGPGEQMSSRGYKDSPGTRAPPKQGGSTSFSPDCVLLDSVTVPLRGKLPWSHQGCLTHRAPQRARWPAPRQGA